MHAIKRHDFLWVGANGANMSGTNGVQLWDLAFIVQALVETGLGEQEENRESLVKALEWLEQAQIGGQSKTLRRCAQTSDQRRLALQHERARLCCQRLHWGGHEGSNLHPRARPVSDDCWYM